MEIEKARRDEIYIEIRDFLNRPEWEAEVNEIDPDDGYDGLDVFVGHLCLEWGSEDTRGFLKSTGVTEDEVEQLIADNIDFYY